MLKAFSFETFIKVNDKEWNDTFHDGWDLYEEEPISKEETFSFDELWKIKKEFDPSCLDFLKADTTLFRGKRYFKYICFGEMKEYFIAEEKVSSIKILRKYRPKNPTMKEIFDHCDADKAIQYFKEKGLNICPYGMEK